MKQILHFLFCLLLCNSSKLVGQAVTSAVKIISVRAGNNQNNEAFKNIDLVSGKPGKLSYDQNYLQFQFINTKNNAQRSISYRLVGLDYSWVSCNDCSQVNYAHLDGGEYTFQVKSNIKNDIPAQFSFVIEGNTRHQWWFIPLLFIYFLMVFAVIIYFFKLYKFRQKHKEQLLIHKEKMSSMVELTAGVAHEIQNPLNFVNNFSGVNRDLIEEMKEAMDKGNIEEAKLIAADLADNELKIIQHGKRAEAIVQSMLQHSQPNTGQKELTDINALFNEYIKLAKRSFFVKHPAFSVNIQTSFDAGINKIMVIPQDIGKVLINLLNNAFYSVTEKKDKSNAAYEPTVTITTKRVGNKIKIIVSDNGAGISTAILSKIFQPFFTTKPTGQGTGLGLSLSYDIIKAHRGEIKVETRESEGVEFIITLPSKID